MLKVASYFLVLGIILSGCSSTLPHQSTANPNAPTTPSVTTQVGPSVMVPSGGGLGLGFGVSGI